MSDDNEQNYVIKLRGKNLDFKQMTLIKHPLQAMLHKGIAPIAQLELNSDARELTVNNYFGSYEALEKAVGKALSKIGSRHHSLVVDYEIEQRPIEQSERATPDINTQELKNKNTALESILAEKQETELVYQEELERLQKEMESVASLKEKAVKVDEYKIELENLKKKNDGLTATKRKTEVELKTLQEEHTSLHKEYDSLSKTLEEINITKISEPIGLVLGRISESANYLMSIGGVLEDLLRDRSIIESLPQNGKPLMHFFEFVNKRLSVNYKSDDDVSTAANVTGNFMETEYAKANIEKYAKVDKALETLANMKTMSDVFGEALDVTKLLTKEDELKAFKKEFENNAITHEQKSLVSRNLQEFREEYNSIKNLDEYLTRVQDQDKTTIPCLIATNLTTNEIEIALPKSEYFLKQLEPILKNSVGGAIEFDKSHHNDVMCYKVQMPEGINAEPSKMARALFTEQQQQEFYKLGFKLQIYTIAKLD